MLKFLLLLAVLAGMFWAGYYIGQQPPDTVKQTIQSFSEDMMEQALGVEKSELQLQREFLEAKDKLLKSQSNLLDGEYREAARQLEEALQHLQQALRFHPAEQGRFLMEALMEKVKAIKESLASGVAVPPEQIREAQRELDTLLEK